MHLTPPPPLHSGVALFLDFDGTLVEIQPRPDTVTVSSALRTTLARVQTALDGALAVVSGRGVDDLEQRLAPLRVPLAGIHGLERRTADGRRQTSATAEATLTPVRATIQQFAADHPGLLAEDKGMAIALHYRNAPTHGPAVEAFMQEQQRRVGGAARLQHGKAVVELIGAGGDKGDAIEAFLREAPFAGRQPVYVGDDVTDEHALARVNAHAGISIHVGSGGPTCAHYRLPSVAAVHTWLEGVTGVPQSVPAQRSV